MDRRFNVAVVGATGVVGEAMLAILEERRFPIGELVPLASERSVGKQVRCQGRTFRVRDLADFDFGEVHIALFSAGAAVSETHAPRAGVAGCIVIDNTSRFRNEPDIPLVVPEVNPEAVGHYAPRNIIANPNCSTIQMLVALNPIYRAVGIERINVATYQAVSGAGRALMDDLASQTAALLSGRPLEGMTTAKQIAFNVLVNPTAVRVPVFYGHSEAIHLETRDPITAEEARALLQAAPGVTVLDRREPGGYPTAVTEAASHDAVFVGRIREDISHARGLNLWVVADNVRKGAALNSIQIAEILAKNYL
jgi:aspartate-semialdehyde dehydrogenase